MSETISQGVGNISMLVSSITVGNTGIDPSGGENENIQIINNEQDEYVLETKLKIIEILQV